MDQQLFFLINRTWTAPWLDPVMAAASSWALWWPILLIAGIFVAILGGFRGRAFLLVAGLAIGLTDGIVVDTLKGIVGRPRPHEVLVGARTLDLAKAKPRFLALGKPLKMELSVARDHPPDRGNSFPSGHASNNFALAAVIFVFYRRWSLVAFSVAALVSYSRIYVGSHWPSDVMVSIILGFGLGLLTCFLAQKLWQWIGPRWLPRWFETHPVLARE